MKLNPVFYTYNGKGSTLKDSKHIGLIAQELQEVVPFLVNEYTHSEYPENSGLEMGQEKINESKYLGIRDNEIKYLLLNSIKDQQEIINNQEEKIDDLEEQIVLINETLKSLLNDRVVRTEIDIIGTNEAFIKQNVPNPFGSETSIEYFIPESAANATIKVYNVSGQLIKDIEIDSRGNGILQINTQDLPSGAYVYQLVIDSQMIGSKQMIQAK